MKTIITLDKANQPYGYPQLDGSGNLPSPYGRPYKVYTALLTQSGGDNTLSIGSGALTKGVTYNASEFAIPPSWDFSNVGGPIAPDFYPFVATSNDTPNDYGGISLTYNTGAPVVTVLENNIGNITWEYQETGYYTGNLTNGFIGDLFFQNDKFVFFSNNLTIGQMAISIYKNDDNQIGIDAFEIDSTYVDSGLYNTPIEIRVYN